MKRIDLRSSFPDRMGRPMPGLFEVLVDEKRLALIAEKAYNNTTHRSTWGGLTVIFRHSSPGQAEYLVAHQKPAPSEDL